MSATKLLWIGDAVAPTGFARVTHNVLQHLADRYEVHVLGVNYRGDPHRHPYKIYPAMLGGDVFGVGRVRELCERLRPDVVLINSDPWIVQDFLGRNRIPPGIPVVAYMPVDAPNQGAATGLAPLARAVAYTKFGRRELVLGGHGGRTDVVPHGVDLDVYRPVPKLEARARLRNPEIDRERAFIVGAVNRNQPRKRLDLTLQYWTAWWQQAGRPSDAYLYLHCVARGEGGWDLPQLADYYGITRQFLMTSTKMTSELAPREADMPIIYSVFDCMLSTSLGEGWGLTTMEGMACGVAQVLPRHSALAEWPEGAAEYVEVTGHAATPDDINTIGAVPGLEGTVAALDRLYRSAARRDELSGMGLALVRRPEFRWASVAERFDEILRGVLAERAVVAPVATAVAP